MPPYERGNVSSVGRDLRVPPLPGGAFEKRRRWLRTVTILPVGADALPQGHWLHIPLMLRGVSLAPAARGLVFPYILCSDRPPNPIVQNAEIGPKISCKNHKKTAQTP